MELFLENIAKDAMDPSTYQYFKGLQDRRIVFNDEVDDRIVESVMLPLLEMDNDGSGKPITIVLNTCGGCTPACLFVILLTISRLRQPFW